MPSYKVGMETMSDRERRSGASSIGLFAAALLVGAGATALAFSWMSKTKDPDKILDRCDSALHELQARLDNLHQA